MNYKQAYWIQNTNIYEINLRQYTAEGTFKAFKKELPRLRNMGVDVFWITECKIDGFRCDMAHLVPLIFWEEARTVLDKVKKELFWFAETEDVAYHLVFDASYTWEWMHKSEDYYKGLTDMNGLWSVLN